MRLRDPILIVSCWIIPITSQIREDLCPVVTSIVHVGMHSMRRGLGRLVGTALTAGIASAEANPGVARRIGAFLPRSNIATHTSSLFSSTEADDARDAPGEGTSSDRVGVGMRGDGTAPRFYKTVEVVQVENGGGWGVALDGRTLKTPKRAALAVPSKSLAMAIAAEWEWQSGRSIRPFTMPLMGLVATSIDNMSQAEVRDFHIRKLLEYFPTDVVLIKHEPGALADAQTTIHAPILKWARRELGPGLEPTESLLGANIPDGTLSAAEKRLRAMDPFELTATFNASASAKSLLTGMALIRGVIDVKHAARSARVEEDFQVDKWGLVEGGHDIDQADIAVRLAAPRALMSLLRDTI